MGRLYTSMKIFHFGEKLESLPKESGRIMAPLHVRIKPTNVCAHNCGYCAYRTDYLQLGKDMGRRDFIPQPKMMEIIGDLADMDVKAVTFSGGGDPFYYPHLAEAVKKLAATKIKFAALTNGAKLSGELAELFSANASWIRISIDGWDEKSYAEYRGVSEDEFRKVMGNIGAFAKLNGNCYLGAVIVVDQKNAAHVYELVSRLKDAGVHSVKVSPCIMSNDGAKNNEYHRDIFEPVKEQAARAMEELAGEGFEIYDSYHLLDDKFTKDYQWCPYLQILPVIGADQNVYSCHDKAYNLDCGLLGSIKEQSFKEMWFSDKNRFYQINPSIHCDHHCVVNRINKQILEFIEADPDHLEFV
ncbi:MAG: radical SAM protein [Nitrospinae bacterium]|nr:radical SAM protein [Nitrospinota bacterium]